MKVGIVGKSTYQNSVTFCKNCKVSKTLQNTEKSLFSYFSLLF